MASNPDQNPSVVERKLVTILSADVAEYSRLMAEDEESTLRTFREHTQTFKALVGLHNGRIFNTAGDALLAEFTSPLEAVRCATDIQAALRTRNDQLPRPRQVKFRIGVNLGDVMMQGTDLLGDGVNVAARLQSAAEPGGICISGTVYDQIRNKLSMNIESLGERRFKNIPQPVRTFTIAGAEDETALPTPAKSSLGGGQFAKSAAAALSGFSLSRGLLIKSGIAGAVLLVLAGGVWAYTSYQPAAVQKSTTNAPAKKLAGASLNLTGLDIQSSALLADAQRLQRPQDEIDNLTASNGQIAALASQLHGLGKKPGDKATASALQLQMKNLVLDMSHNEATTLDRAAAPMWHDIEQPPGKAAAADASAALAKAQQAKSDFDNKIAAAQQAQDPGVSLKATRQALVAYEAFASAYDAVSPIYISAKRSEFAALVAAAQSVSSRLAALGNVSKPWLFASEARKNAYETLSRNAAEALSQGAQLSVLERRVGDDGSLRKVSVALSKASAIKARLGRLLASSDAAYAVYSR